MHLSSKQIRFKTAMLRSSLCDYSDAYLLVKGNISVTNTATQGAAGTNTNKTVVFKTCAPFTSCISKINNTQIDNAEYIDIVMLMYNLIEYNDNYSKTSGSLWQYCKDIPAVNNAGNIVDFTATDTTDSFKFKTKITGQTNNNGRIDVEIMTDLNPERKCCNHYCFRLVLFIFPIMFAPVFLRNKHERVKAFFRCIIFLLTITKPNLLTKNDILKSTSKIFTYESIDACNLLHTSHIHNAFVFFALSKFKYRNKDSFFKLLLLLSGDISLNPGPSHINQTSDNNEWDVFKA